MKLALLILALGANSALAACPSACSGHGTCDKNDFCVCYQEGKEMYKVGDIETTVTFTTSAGTNRIVCPGYEVTGTVNSESVSATLSGSGACALSSGNSVTTNPTYNVFATSASAWTGAYTTVKLLIVNSNVASTFSIGTAVTFASGGTGNVIYVYWDSTNTNILIDQCVGTCTGTTNAISSPASTTLTAGPAAATFVTSATSVSAAINFGNNLAAAWTGADCSLRTCPRAMSWSRADETAVAAKASTTAGTVLHHDNVECSDAGLCDRSSGVCQCFDGYEGSACQRTECPNDCGGRGTCEPNTEFARLAGVRYSGAWDSGKHFGCLCDTGYRGSDCSLVECPSGPDPAYHTDSPDHHTGHSGNGQGRDCSGRGICDYSTGLCTCFAGYTGNDCGDISALA